jgi:hypothetical protein
MSWFTKRTQKRRHTLNIVGPEAQNFASSIQSIKLHPPTMNKIFRVEILLGGGGLKLKHVVARNEKSALLKVIEEIPQDDPAWSAPGWRQVQVYEASNAFVL